MNEKKKYLIYVLIFTTAQIGLVIFFTYFVDPYGITNASLINGVKKGYSHLDRIGKLYEIHHINPETIMLGGSRIAYMDSADIKKITNDRVYNLGLTACSLEEQFAYLKYAVDNFDIKNVIIVLAFYTFGDSHGVNENFDAQLMTGSLLSKIKLYGKLFFSFQAVSDAFEVYSTRNPPVFWNMYDGFGNRTLDYQNRLIREKETRERILSSLTHYQNYEYRDWQFSENKLEIFRQTIDFCRDRQINCRVYISPINDNLLQLIFRLGHRHQFEQWKAKLARITVYYDFVGPNSVTGNDENYIDISHIKKEFGSIMFHRIYNPLSKIGPSDFGKFVDRN